MRPSFFELLPGNVGFLGHVLEDFRLDFGFDRSSADVKDGFFVLRLGGDARLPVGLAQDHDLGAALFDSRLGLGLYGHPVVDVIFEPFQLEFRDHGAGSDDAAGLGQFRQRELLLARVAGTAHSRRSNGGIVARFDRAADAQSRFQRARGGDRVRN